jgi:hypothetical protein
VLAFLGTYSRADVLAALERAVRYGAYAASSVERILASQARPLGLLEKLAAQTQTEPPNADNSPAIEPRSTKEYQLLLPEDSADAAPPQTEPSPNAPSRGSPGGSREDEPPEGASSVEECPF